MTDNELINVWYARQGGKPVLQADISFYESSWDMLMPIVEKIKTILQNLQDSRPQHTACYGDLIEVDIHCALHEVNISMVHKAVVEFIKWHNEQPKH